MSSIYLLQSRPTASVGAPSALDAPDVSSVVHLPQGPSTIGSLIPADSAAAAKVPDLSAVPQVILTSATSYLPFIGVGIASAMGTAIFAYVMKKRSKLKGDVDEERRHVLHVVLRDERTQSGPGVAELELNR